MIRTAAFGMLFGMAVALAGLYWLEPSSAGSISLVIVASLTLGGAVVGILVQLFKKS